MSAISYVSDSNPVYKHDSFRPTVVTIDNILNEVIDLDLLSSKQYKLLLSNCKRKIKALNWKQDHEEMSQQDYREISWKIKDIEDLRDMLNDHFTEYLI